MLCIEPVLRTARRRFPDARITLALPDPYVQLFLGNRTVDAVRPIKGDYGELRKLAKEHDLWFPLEGYENKHSTENNGKMVKSRTLIWCETVGVPVDDLCPHWSPRDSEREAVVKRLKALKIKPFSYIILHWGSKNTSKDYPYNMDLCSLLISSGHKVLLVHDARLPEIKGAIEVIGVPLRELGAIVEQAGLVICPDSGLCHFAAATGTPAIAICSVTDGRVYFGDYPHCLVLQNTDTKGKPCEGQAPCWGISPYFWCKRRPREAGWCMEVYTPQRILEIAERRLLECETYNQERLSTETRT